MKHSLSRQLLSVGILIVGIIFFSLGILLPKVLLPVYERNIYNYLKQPLELIRPDLEDNEVNTDVAYLYITADQTVITSDNLKEVIKASPKQILKNIKEDYGKFIYLGKTYY